MGAKKNKYTLVHVLGNIFWLLRYTYIYAPVLFWDKLIRIPIAVISTYINVNLTYWILNKIESGRDISRVIIMIVGIFSFFIVSNFIIAFLDNAIVPQKAIDLSSKMREDIIGKVKRIDQINFQKTSFYDKYTLALKEIDGRAINVLASISTILVSGISFFLITGVTATIDGFFSLLGIGAVVIDTSLGMVRQKYNYNQNVETTPDGRRRGYINRVTYQAEFSPDLKVYQDYEDLLVHRYRQATLSVKKILLRYARKIFFLDQCSQIPSLLLRQVIPWVVVSVLLISNRISISEATILTSAALIIPNTLTSFINGVSQLYPHGLYIENLRDIFSYPENIEKYNQNQLELGQIDSIDVCNVTFSYSSDSQHVLSHLSLSIRRGEKIALVGYNGAGKSTLAKLLIRLFDPGEGSIHINGTNAKLYNVKALRSKISYLGQDFKIYGFTIAENVLMRPVKNEEDEKTVMEILQKVGLDQKVKKLRNGVHTYITKEFDCDGEYFSGGELQKLSLARLYASDSECIIMDESTSALDPVSENEIIEKIFDIFNDKTIIMISHRLATIKYVDRVIFLSDGTLCEQGKHKQLLQENNEYARFYLSQAKKYDR